MQILMIEQTKNVNAGFLEDIAVLVAVITLPKTIHDHEKEYSEWGHNLSREYWDSTYPYDPNSNACYGPYC